MDISITKIFKINNINHEVTIKGGFVGFLFKASDVAEILKIQNMNSFIEEFNDCTKVYLSINNQKICFLTEMGLHFVTYKAELEEETKIAEIFREWACKIIKDLRQKLGNQIKKNFIEENINKELEEKREIKELNKKIETINKIKFIYIYNIDITDTNTKLMIGCSQNFINTIQNLKETYENGKIESIVEIDIDINDLEKFEEQIHYILDNYLYETNIFEINVLEATLIIADFMRILRIINIPDKEERIFKLTQIHEINEKILNN